MNDHFIKNIEIKNFKCFENFKAEGFGRVNLIGGKNNVGKTAFMEAIYVNVHAQDIKSFTQVLYAIKHMRENLNLLSIGKSHGNVLEFVDLSNNIFIISNKNIAHFKFEENDGTKNYFFDFKDEKIKVNSNQFSITTKSIENIEFIDNFGLCNNEIISNYSFIQKQDEELYLNRILNIFDERIEVFKVIYETPQCKVNGKYLEITELGDGIRHLISIVTSLYKCKNGYLFIDEIDNGIHHSKLDKLWNIILTISKQQNVQVFATTHSKECIKALLTANTENVKTYQPKEHILESEEIKFIELGRTDGKVDSIIFDFDELKNEVEQNMEIRGW